MCRTNVSMGIKIQNSWFRGKEPLRLGNRNLKILVYLETMSFWSLVPKKTFILPIKTTWIQSLSYFDQDPFPHKDSAESILGKDVVKSLREVTFSQSVWNFGSDIRWYVEEKSLWALRFKNAWFRDIEPFRLENGRKRNLRYIRYLDISCISRNHDFLKLKTRWHLFYTSRTTRIQNLRYFDREPRILRSPFWEKA